MFLNVVNYTSSNLKSYFVDSIRNEASVLIMLSIEISWIMIEFNLCFIICKFCRSSRNSEQDENFELFNLRIMGLEKTNKELISKLQSKEEEMATSKGMWLGN